VTNTNMSDQICFNNVLFMVFTIVIVLIVLFFISYKYQEVEELKRENEMIKNNCTISKLKSELNDYNITTSPQLPSSSPQLTLTSPQLTLTSPQLTSASNNTSDFINKDDNKYRYRYKYSNKFDETRNMRNMDPILPLTDPVVEYDYDNLSNPLSGPTSRPPSYVFGPTLMNPLFNTPTQGLPDNFSYVGNLIEITDDEHDRYDKKRKTNKRNNESELDSESEEKRKSDIPNTNIIQLLGRQRYSNGSKYDYYVIISRGGNDFIKLDIKTRNDEELYDGDTVRIPEINKTYKLKKNKSFWKQYFH